MAGAKAALWAWEDWKVFFERSVGFSSDALHIIVSVLIFVAASLLLRRSIASWLPWLVVLGFMLFNELADLMFERWPNAAMQYGEGTKDVLLTMFVPTVLFLSARVVPSVYSGRRRVRRQ